MEVIGVPFVAVGDNSGYYIKLSEVSFLPVFSVRFLYYLMG